MAFRINHVNKTNGVTYVYESTSYWNKEKKQPCSKQRCIGKLNSVTGEFVPSKRLQSAQVALTDQTVTASAEIIGATTILDHITTTLTQL